MERLPEIRIEDGIFIIDERSELSELIAIGMEPDHAQVIIRQRDEHLLANLEFQPSWTSLLSVMAAWQKANFPHVTPLSTNSHMKREVAELDGHEEEAEEWADILFLAMQGGVLACNDSPTKFYEAVLKKLRVNMTERKWSDPDALGVVEHDRNVTGVD